MDDNSIGKFMKYFFSTIGIMICLSLIGVAIYYIYTVVSSRDYKDIHASYNVNSDIDYKVYMNDNKFIPNEYLPMEKTYITKLVDRVESKFSFEYSDEEENAINYSYILKGTLTGSYIDSSASGKEVVVWTEEDILKNVDTKAASNGQLAINELINTNVEALNARVKSFEEEMLIPLVADYKIELVINVILNLDGDAVIKTHNVVLNIPINESVFSIDKSVESNKNVDVAREVEPFVINKLYLFLSVLLIAGSIIAIINLLRFGYKDERDDYEDELEDIFKLYGDRIVSVGNIAIKDDTEFIDLIGFVEMIELVDELNLPLLCWTNEEHNETWFCAIKGNLIYRYAITKEEIN